MPSPVRRGFYRRKHGAHMRTIYGKRIRGSLHSLSSDRKRRAKRGTRKQVHRYPQAYD